MKIPANPARVRGSARFFAWLVLVAAAAGGIPVLAQDEIAARPEHEDPAVGADGQSATPTSGSDALSPEERRQREREARIEEYLRKKEEKRARQEAEAKSAKQNDQEAAALARAQELEREQIAAEVAKTSPPPAPASPRPAGSVPAPAVVTEEAPVSGNPAGEKKSKPRALPRDLARAQANVRATPLGADETVRDYLDRIDRQEASAHQLAAFANFLADNGLVQDAVEYYDVALRLDSKDPVLWVNAGTLQRKLGRTGPALSAYNRALSLDPNQAMAHYNIGSVLHSQGKYKEAILAFKTALSLEPGLGDPVYNPGAANNDLLVAVKMMLYQEQSGNLGLPLSDIQPDAPTQAPAKPPTGPAGG